MTAKEQNAVKRVAYNKAMRCVKEAKLLMKKAPKDGIACSRVIEMGFENVMNIINKIRPTEAL